MKEYIFGSNNKSLYTVVYIRLLSTLSRPSDRALFGNYIWKSFAAHPWRSQSIASAALFDITSPAADVATTDPGRRGTVRRWQVEIILRSSSSMTFPAR